MDGLIYILGNGGHARVLAGVLDSLAREYRFTTDNDIPADGIGVIGFGDLEKRRRLWEEREFHFDVIDPSAVVRGTVGPAAQVMARAVIQPGARILANVIVNTGATVDHDCVIGPHSHIAPGATLCGDVKIGESCFVGAGATIVQGVELPDRTFVPAGSLVCGANDIRKMRRSP